MRARAFPPLPTKSLPPPSKLRARPHKLGHGAKTTRMPEARLAPPCTERGWRVCSNRRPEQVWESGGGRPTPYIFRAAPQGSRTNVHQPASFLRPRAYRCHAPRLAHRHNNDNRRGLPSQHVIPLQQGGKTPRHHTPDDLGKRRTPLIHRARPRRPRVFQSKSRAHLWRRAHAHARRRAKARGLGHR